MTTTTPPFLRQDLAVSAAALLLLLAWDFSGLDLTFAAFFGNALGFAARDAFWASRLLHDGGRIAAWVLMVLLVVAALRAPAGEQPGRPGRAERWRWIAVMLVAIAAVPGIKRFSLTSCPWDLSLFGGAAQYVSHWRLGVADGGGGGCFPSGHAAAAFGFFGLYFLWRGHDAKVARTWLLAVLVVGFLFGTAQLARGAHYPSHTLWSAWLCWAICVAAAQWRSRSLHTRASA